MNGQTGPIGGTIGRVDEGINKPKKINIPEMSQKKVTEKGDRKR